MLTFHIQSQSLHKDVGSGVSKEFKNVENCRHYFFCLPLECILLVRQSYSHWIQPISSSFPVTLQIQVKIWSKNDLITPLRKLVRRPITLRCIGYLSRYPQVADTKGYLPPINGNEICKFHVLRYIGPFICLHTYFC